MFLKVLMFEATYKLLWHVYTFCELLFNLWVYFSRKIGDFYHDYTIKDHSGYIFKSTQNVDKIPKHLTILLGNEEPSYTDLANLAMWCIATGIPFISFYDHKGILKTKESKLQAAIEKRKPSGTHIIWHDSEYSTKNGVTGRKVFVRTLSPLDGRQSVADLAKNLSTNTANKIDQQEVESNLKHSFLFPDPELGLYCGQVFSIYGYPPWQIRTTEFLPVGTHYGISPHRFVEAMHIYNKTEQRLGK